MVQMMRVHAPEKNCCGSRQPESGRFAPRGFACRIEDKETAGEHKPFPLDFDMTRLPLYPPVQAKLADGNSEDGQENAEPEDSQQEPNRTGMPDRLKAGIEALSGIDMSDVRVHANSPKPMQLGALAYTLGNQIYMGPGQGRHLPHEAWHVVQQAEGRVWPKLRMKGMVVNDDAGLEGEAEAMGGLALLAGEVGGHAFPRETTSSLAPIMPFAIQRQISNTEESNRVDNWVAKEANTRLRILSPDSINEAPQSEAIRLRWYDVLIGEASYLIGVNIHYGGTFGALWVKNNATKETNEYHPLQPPQHGLNMATLAALQRHVYEFDTVLYYKATTPRPADGDWDRQFAGA